MFLLVALLVVLAFFVYRGLLGYPATNHRVLSRGEAAFLETAAQTVFPAHSRFPADGAGADLAVYADRYLATLSVRQRRLIRALFLLFEQATLIFPARGVGAFRRFSSMSPEQRRAYLDGWANSRWPMRKMALDALKAVLIMGFLGKADNLAALGLTPFEIAPVVVEADLLYPPIGQPRSAVRYREADLSVDRARPPLRSVEGRP